MTCDESRTFTSGFAAIGKLFRVRFRQRNRSLPKYVTPTSSRPNISLTEPDFVIEGVLVSRAFDPQQRSNNSRIAPYSHLLGAFLLLLVIVDRAFSSRFLDQVGFRQRSTAVCYQNKVIIPATLPAGLMTAPGSSRGSSALAEA